MQHRVFSIGVFWGNGPVAYQRETGTQCPPRVKPPLSPTGGHWSPKPTGHGLTRPVVSQPCIGMRSFRGEVRSGRETFHRISRADLWEGNLPGSVHPRVSARRHLVT